MARKKKNVKKDNQLNSKQMQRRMYIVLGVVVLMFCALIYRLFFLAYFESDRLIKIQDSQIEVEREIIPPRGDILDRNGKPLAKDTPLSRVVIDPKLFHDDWCLFGSSKCGEEDPERKQRRVEREKKTLSNVASALSMDLKTLMRYIVDQPSRRYKIIANEVPPDVVGNTYELKSLSPYLYLDYYYRRFYPLKESASSLLGVVNHQGQGISGIERSFNEHLQSTTGRVLEKYSGKVGLRRKGDTPPRRKIFYSEELEKSAEGNPLRLSIDSYIQHICFKVLAEDTLAFDGEKSSAIVVDITTGEILALADFPGTNPNNRQDLKFDYTVSSSMSETIEPGSAIKPLVMAGLLDKGLFSMSEVLDTSPGHIYIDKWLVKDVKNYKKLRPSQIIQKSSNVGMVKLTERIEGAELSHFFNTLGLNESTGIFPGLEAIGNLGNAWESDVTKLNQSYGYGLEVTMLALARAYVALAREGELIPLTIVKDAKFTTSQQVVRPQVAKAILKWMELVTQPEGTGRKAAVPGLRIAGKTGTARARGFKLDTNEVYNNNFAGIFPADNPRFLVLVGYRNVEPPYHYGGSASAVSFERIVSVMKNYLHLR